MKKTTCWSRLAVAAVMLFPALAPREMAGQDGGVEVDKRPGLAIGEKAPSFALKDQEGKTVELSDLLKDGDFAALVFHRSAEW